jgi:hypothetical protein
VSRENLKWVSPDLGSVGLQTFMTGFPNWDVMKVWYETKYNLKLKHQKMKMPSTMKGPVFIYNIVQDMRLLYQVLYLNLVLCKIDHFHIQLHHVPDNKLYLLAVAMTLAQLVKILLARDS